MCCVFQMTAARSGLVDAVLTGLVDACVNLPGVYLCPVCELCYFRRFKFETNI